MDAALSDMVSVTEFRIEEAGIRFIITIIYYHNYFASQLFCITIIFVSERKSYENS